MMHTVIEAFAPGRVNLIGEHTDYNLGRALPIALDIGTTVDFRHDDGSEPRVITARSAERSVRILLDTEPGEVGGWGAYVAGCVWALRRSGYQVPPGELSISSQVPAGAGLSSSAALECAVLLALTAHSPLPPLTLARLAQQAENDYVGAPTGLLDQLAAMFGARDTALLIDFRDPALTPVPMPSTEDARLLVIDSRAPHRNAAGEYARRRAECARAADALGVDALSDADTDAWHRLPRGPVRCRARHVLTENQRVLDTVDALAARDLMAVGALLNASHVSMRDDFEITTGHIDLITETAVSLGALGARMTGGGFGGSVIVLATPADAVRIRADLAGTVTRAGYPTPSIRYVRPGAGAHLR